MDTLKGLLFSKTAWFNAVIAALGVADWITGHSSIIAAVIPDAGPWFAAIGAAGVILRTITKQPLAEKANPSPFPQ